MKSKIIQCCEFCEENMDKECKGFEIKCNFDCYHYACEKCFKKLNKKPEEIKK